MTEPKDEHCAACGQPLHGGRTDARTQDNAGLESHVAEDPQEVDHRGLPLPRRSRNGGIITPQ